MPLSRLRKHQISEAANLLFKKTFISLSVSGDLESDTPQVSIDSQFIANAIELGSLDKLVESYSPDADERSYFKAQMMQLMKPIVLLQEQASPRSGARSTMATLMTGSLPTAPEQLAKSVFETYKIDYPWPAGLQERLAYLDGLADQLVASGDLFQGSDASVVPQARALLIQQVVGMRQELSRNSSLQALDYLSAQGLLTITGVDKHQQLVKAPVSLDDTLLSQAIRTVPGSVQHAVAIGRISPELLPDGGARKQVNEILGFLQENASELMALHTLMEQGVIEKMTPQQQLALVQAVRQSDDPNQIFRGLIKPYIVSGNLMSLVGYDTPSFDGGYDPAPLIAVAQDASKQMAFDAVERLVDGYVNQHSDCADYTPLQKSNEKHRILNVFRINMQKAVYRFSPARALEDAFFDVDSTLTADDIRGYGRLDTTSCKALEHAMETRVSIDVEALLIQIYHQGLMDSEQYGQAYQACEERARHITKPSNDSDGQNLSSALKSCGLEIDFDALEKNMPSELAADENIQEIIQVARSYGQAATHSV